jgi:hypothetical protein
VIKKVFPGGILLLTTLMLFLFAGTDRIRSNVCQVCYAKLTALQSNDCRDSQTRYLEDEIWACTLCMRKQFALPTVPNGELVIDAGQFAGGELFGRVSPAPEAGIAAFGNAQAQFRSPLTDFSELPPEYNPNVVDDNGDLLVAPVDLVVKLFENSIISTAVSLPPGFYQLQFYGENDQPGPVLLQTSVNQKPLGVISFNLDDESWGTRCLWLHPVYWADAVNHEMVIGIRFINDGGEGGSRDAAVAQMRIVPVTR